MIARAAKAATAAFAGAVLLTAGLAGLKALDQIYPPPLRGAPISSEVVDRDGVLLRAFATPDGLWRLPSTLDAVDPNFVAMLVAYEDRRFFEHSGVDPLATLRAAKQLIINGRIVSGASTLTMQLARLIEPRSERSLTTKLRQMVRAIQIERRLTKREILERYLTLAPYGGNLEGVRAASLAWFGKEPKRLALAEAAMLVALPQAPESRRPDRNPRIAKAARDRVLARMTGAGILPEGEIARASPSPVPTLRRPLPALAAHAAEDALKRRPGIQRVQLTIDATAQTGLESVARERARALGPSLSLAMLMADARTGEIVAHVGSADYFDARRAGYIDMTRVLRSPGSTLKPFIYGLAFEEGVIAQETMIDDSPADFSGYRPKNFDMEYQGEVSIRTALQMSLNVPAIKLLDQVGPARLVAALQKTGVRPVLPAGEAPGLAIGLGGAGLTLRDLVQAYTAFADRGEANELTIEPRAPRRSARLIDAASAWQIGDILSGVVPPTGAPKLGLAYKTGTSYGYRDAWSIGFDGRHVLGVWVGRPDGGWVPGLTGYGSAAPILFEAFARSGIARTPLPPAPPGAVRLARADLPVTQLRFVGDKRSGSVRAPEPAPIILFPPDGARIELSSIDGALDPLALKLQGGRAPFRWLANGRPLSLPGRKRSASWTPDGAGSSTLTVVDAAGRAATARVHIERLQ